MEDDNNPPSTPTSANESTFQKIMGKIITVIITIYVAPYMFIDYLFGNYPVWQFIFKLAWIIFAIIATYYLLKFIINKIFDFFES